jgi:hypothetical protein
MAITVTHKTCTRCRIEKLASEFPVSDKYKSGLYSRCKKCQSEITADWNRKNAERHKENKSRSDRRLRRERADDTDRCVSYSPDRTTKRCPMCEKRFPVEQFSRLYENGKRSAYCKDCKNEHTRTRRANDPNKVARYLKNNMRRRGVTPEQFNELLVRQGGVCAICGKEPGILRFSIDHDHRCCSKSVRRDCGKCVRGLLCSPCNTLLNRLDFNPQWMSKALAYLGKTRGIHENSSARRQVNARVH